jgi:hypothetical protein
MIDTAKVQSTRVYVLTVHNDEDTVQAMLVTPDVGLAAERLLLLVEEYQDDFENLELVSNHSDMVEYVHTDRDSVERALVGLHQDVQEVQLIAGAGEVCATVQASDMVSRARAN